MTTKEALDGPCCFLELCCEWPRTGAALTARHPELSMEGAKAILDNYRLVPKELPAAGAAKETAIALTAQKELAQIHRMLRARLPRILEDLGYGKMELRPPEEPA